MTTITYNDKELTLDGDAHISDDSKTYQALACDNQGNSYLVVWDVTINDIDKSEDESNACDWDDFRVVED